MIIIFGVEFFAAFQAVLTIVILMAVGFAMSHYGKITKEISSFITWIVVNVSLPCLMTYTILTSFDRSEISTIPRAIAAPLLSIAIGYIAGFVVVKLIKPRSGRAGQMIVQTAQNNTIFMGLPVNIAMLGEVSVPYVLYYYIANTLFFWSLGVYLISERRSGKGKNVLGVFLTPPMFGIYIGAISLMTGFTLPKFSLDTLRYIGNLTTPFSMFFIGHILWRLGLKNIKVDKDVVIGLLCRFILGPVIAIPLFRFLGVTGMMLSVFVIQSFMPVMANGSIVAEQYGSDSQYAAVMTSVSTIVSLLLLPIIKVLFVG